MLVNENNIEHKSLDIKDMTPIGIFVCHNNSYPFEDRKLCLKQAIKIGRSVARAKAATDNAIFDCKVLSRNHAVLWYDSQKFYLKDTKSSNGTFVNNKRLSQSGEESDPHEIFSGDIVQFGVDVVESTKKVTHGCIVALLKLYLPDGKEAKPSPITPVTYINITLEDMHKLNQLLQEATKREKNLYSKLEYMHQILNHSKFSITKSWKTLIFDESLISRLEILENRIMAYSKNFSKDNLRKEIVRLLEGKVQYQVVVRELLQKKLKEKQELITGIKVLKLQFKDMEEETLHLHKTILDNKNKLQELTVKHIKTQEVLNQTVNDLLETKNALKEAVKNLNKEKQNVNNSVKQENLKSNFILSNQKSEMNDMIAHEQTTALLNYMQNSLNLKKKVCTENFEHKNFNNPIEVVDIIIDKLNFGWLKKIDLTARQKNEAKSSFLLETNIYQILYGASRSESEKASPNKKRLLPNGTTNSNLKILNKGALVESNIFKVIKYVTKEANLKNFASLYKIFEYFDGDGYVAKDNLKHLLNIQGDVKTQHLIKCKDVLNYFMYMQSKLSKVHNINSLKLIDVNGTFTAGKKVIPKSSFVDLETESDLIPKYFQDIILKTLLCSLKSLTTPNKSTKNCTLSQNLQELKYWLIHEENDVIISKFKQLFTFLENDLHKIEELNEQLLVLKEKYYQVLNEKKNFSNKYTSLKLDQRKNLTVYSKTHIYFFLTLIIVFVWILYQK